MQPTDDTILCTVNQNVESEENIEEDNTLEDPVIHSLQSGWQGQEEMNIQDVKFEEDLFSQSYSSDSSNDCFTEDSEQSGNREESDTSRDSEDDESNIPDGTESQYLETVFKELNNVMMFPDQNLTTWDVSLMIIGLCIRYNLSYVVRKAIFALIKVLAGPQFEHWNISKFKISQMYDPPDEAITLCFFCTACNRPLLSPMSKCKFKKCKITCKCGEMHFLTTQSPNYVIFIDGEYQIKILLQNKKLNLALLKYVDIIKENMNSDNSVISDVYDGALYKELMEKYSESFSFLTFNFNTDGAPIFHSSKRSMWPIQIIINELPPELRFKFPFLGGMCIMEKEPSPEMMKIYMQRFLQNTEKLRKEGFSITVSVTMLC